MKRGGLMRYFKFIVVFVIGTVLPVTGFAENDTSMKEDNHHIRKWNAFANDALKLQQELVKNEPCDVKRSVGGYAGNKDFYIQEQYISKRTGKLVCQLQWEKANPDVLHSIEVYVHDDEGRVIRDYTAAYLPGYNNAPVQTLVSFHQYSGKLHGFRSFDASGDLTLERCEGEYKGKAFEFLMDEDDLYAAYMNGNPIDETVYSHCVGNLTDNPGKYLKPQ